MTDLKIHSYPDNPRAQKALIAAEYVGVKIDVPAFEFGKDNKAQAFTKKFPLGKVPALEGSDGCLFESNAIARYVARLGKANIYGSTPFESGLIDQWIDFTSWEIDLPNAAWIYPVLGFFPNNPLATTKAKGDIRKALNVLNNHLKFRTFLVGDRVTLADIVVVCALKWLYTTVLEPGFRKAFVHTNRWFLTCVNQPEFKKVLGEVKLCEKEKKAPAASAAAAPAAEKKEKAKKEKKPAENKPAKKKPAKNPLDALPKSKFILDEWKRIWSNEDSRKKAIPWFWENFDAEGYSLYFGDYKYNDENKMDFMTANLVGGMIQRLDPLRKYGFGSFCILEKGGTFPIKSAWVFRGPEIPQEMKDSVDYEHYQFTKVDTSDAAQKKLFEDLLAWDGDFGDADAKLSEGKAFK